MRTRPRPASFETGADGPGHERWMVSYADFITLLFAFFVVMYAISSVNESKYRAVSDTLRESFGPGRGTDAVIGLPAAIAASPEALEPAAPETPAVIIEPEPVDPLAAMTDELTAALRDLIGSGEVRVTRTERGIELEMRSAVLFPTASSDLSKRSEQLLADMARVLTEPGLRIAVEGFTDDLPIRTARFPSNWELSAARAASVVRVFEDRGVEANALSATGYGPHRPVVENADALSRARNRRVVVVIRAAEVGA